MSPRFSPLALAVLLTLAPAALRAQSTLIFNPYYPTIPGDPEPRTLLWTDARNWGGTVPGELDTANLDHTSSQLASTLTVGSVHLNTTGISDREGQSGSLEVLHDFTVVSDDGPVTFFNALILRGTTTVGSGADDAISSVNLFRSVDNYGDFTLATKAYSPFNLGNYSSPTPVFTNRTGATFTFGVAAPATTQLSGTYARFVNETGATLTENGAGDATISFTDADSHPSFDNHGTLATSTGLLTLVGSGDWDGGSLVLSDNAHVRFNFALPTGVIDISGTGRLSTIGDGNTGDTTLRFAADSAITLDGFGLYNIHNLTLDGPVTLRDVTLPGDGLLTFRGTPTIDLTSPNSYGNYTSSFATDVRNEGTLTLNGSASGLSYLNLGDKTFTNAAGATLALNGDLRLAGVSTTLVNPFDASLNVYGPGHAIIEWRLDNAGTVVVDGGTLSLGNPGAWTTGNVLAIGHDAQVIFTGTNTAPTGFINLIHTDETSGGTVVFGGGLNFQDSFTVHGTSRIAVEFAGSPGYYPSISGPDTTLTIDGASRVWGDTLTGTGTDDATQAALLHLADGVTLGPGAAPENFFNIAGPRLLTTGQVTLDGTYNVGVDVTYGWTNTGTLTKTGENTFAIRGSFYNQGYLEVLEGTLFDYAGGDWTGSTTTIDSGATFAAQGVLPTGGIFTGHGVVDLNPLYSTAIFDPTGGSGNYTLPFAVGNHLTLTGAHWQANGTLTVNTDTDFMGNTLAFTGGLVLNADTHWGPRSGTTPAEGSNFFFGVVENHADATLRGALVAGWIPLVGTVDSILWRNTSGSTFTVSGDTDSPGLLSHNINMAPGDHAVLVNQAGATFIAGFGGGLVDWTLNNQGTIRVINGETLTTTAAGDWDGGRVELFQSYLNFRNTLPSGEISVVGAGDIGFGAATPIGLGNYSREAIIVPEAGTTIRSLPTAGGTTLDLGLFGDLTGPGRFTLDGGRIGIEPALDGGFLPTNNRNAVYWTNEGGVDFRGDLTLTGYLDPGTTDYPLLGINSGVNVYGHTTLSGIILSVSQNGINLTTTPLRVHSGATLELTNNAYLEIFGGFDNHGTLILDSSVFGLGGNQSFGDWENARVVFTGTGSEISLGSFVSATHLTFAGRGSVNFGNGFALDGGVFTFQRTGGDFFLPTRPTVDISAAKFETANTRLTLGGNAHLVTLAPLTYAAGDTIELAGDFRLLAPGVNAPFLIGVPVVQNFGTVDTFTNTGASTPVRALAAPDTGIVWQNQEGSSLTLVYGTDLTSYPLNLPPGPINPIFINDVGAQFIADHLGYDNQGTSITWDFDNRGEVIARHGAIITFQGQLTNASTGTFRLESGGQIDFGANTVALGDNFASDGGRMQAQQVVVTHDTSPNVVSGLTIASGSLSIQNNANLNVGSGALVLESPVSGQGTISAGSVTWTGGTFISTEASTLTFNAPTYVRNGATVDFGADSQITFTEGLGGTGTVSAGELVVTGIVTPGSSPGTLALVGDTTFASDTVFNFELGLTAQDLITVDGNLALDGTVNLTGLYDLVSGTYTLFTYTGSLTDQGLALGTLGSGITAASLFVDLDHQLVGVNLTAAAVPEPSTCAAIAGALVLGFVVWRRRSRAA